MISLVEEFDCCLVSVVVVVEMLLVLVFIVVLEVVFMAVVGVVLVIGVVCFGIGLVWLGSVLVGRFAVQYGYLLGLVLNVIIGLIFEWGGDVWVDVGTEPNFWFMANYIGWYVGWGFTVLVVVVLVLMLMFWLLEYFFYNWGGFIFWCEF